MKWFLNCESLEQLKKIYKELILKHHPDRGGDNATMAEINNEYEKMFKLLQEKSTNKTEQVEDVNEYREIINNLLNLAGIEIEICGAWLWISGETKPHKEALKALGCYWASKKKLWYWRPVEAACFFNKHPKSMEEIREVYGSSVLKAKEHKKLDEKTA